MDRKVVRGVRGVVLAALLLSCTMFFQHPASASSVNLAWGAVSDPSLAGYKVYYSTASGVYTNFIDVGNNTTATVPNLLPDVTYYFVVTAYDTNNLESLPSNEVSYLVPSGNHFPTLNAIANVSINENSGLRTVNLSGITSGSVNENDTLTITASSSNPGLIPDPTVNYTSPNTTGSLSFTPVTDAFGTAVITVTVNDNQPSNNIVTRTFTVAVNFINNAPTLNPLSNVTVN